MEIYGLLPNLLANIPEPTIIEVGCHMGEDTLEMFRLFPHAKIIAFEPDPRSVAQLHARGFSKIATLVEAAVGAEDGSATFRLSSGSPPKNDSAFDPKYRNHPWTASSSLKAPKEHLKQFPWVKFDLTAKVKVMRLDTYFEQAKLDRVDFMWADVQGAEDLLIAGGQQTLARTRYFYTEFYDQELYEGQIDLRTIQSRLPGKWSLLARWDNDVLFKNEAMAG